jgi:cytochrome c553
MKRFFLSALAATGLFMMGAAHAADVEKGRQKAEALCAACHATKAGDKFDWSKPLAPENPILAGQHRDYLVAALQAYKQGDKSVIGRKNAVMAQFAGQLDSADINNLAAYFSAQPGSLSVKR